MKILFLTTVLPLSPSTGGEIVSSVYVKSLVDLGHSVDVLGYSRKGDRAKVARPYISVGARVIETGRSKIMAAYWYVLCLFSNAPYSSQKYKGRGYRKKVGQLMKAGGYDCVIIDHSQTGWVLDEIPRDTKIIFISHNVEADLYKELADSSTSVLKGMVYKREMCLMLRLEQSILDRSAQTWVLTRADKDRYTELFGNIGSVVPFDIPSLMSPDVVEGDKRFDIGLIGTWTWESNKKGLVYFMDEVVPLLPEGLSIKIAGKGAEALVPSNGGVEYLGFVDSAENFMRQGRVVVIPSVAGAGVQVKTIDAISVGIPIVASNLALRGISNPPSYVKEAKTASEFSKHIVGFIEGGNYNYVAESSCWVADRNYDFSDSISKQLKIFEGCSGV